MPPMSTTSLSTNTAVATADKRPIHANASVKHLPARSPKSKIVKMQKSHRLSVKHNSRDNYAILAKVHKATLISDERIRKKIHKREP